ncbi:MAG: hypothetical protein CSB16_02290 [Clostridiales bacterium]|nr:MAG: hypothetical protein CSB16_02290 [Clostridiales bacterium]
MVKKFMKHCKHNKMLEILKNNKIILNSKIYILKQLSAKELLFFKKEHIKDISLITSKTVIHRNDKELLLLFEDLINNKNNCLLGIFTNEKELIGRISFYNYNERNYSVELGYFLSDSYQGVGIMTQIIKYIIDKLFSSDGFNKIYCQTASFNDKSCDLLKKCGFSQEGLLREHHKYNGVLFDDYLFSILKKEWVNNVQINT